MTGQEAVDRLIAIAKVDIDDDTLRHITFNVLDNPKFVDGYGAAVGSAHAHHAYRGGLAVHTFEVTNFCLNAIGSHSLKEIKGDVLLTAAICHDYYKIYDYDKEGNKTEYKKLVRHLSGSHAWFVGMAMDYNLPDDLQLSIEHCILAHHGRQEWGSPVEPQTVEASILHYADMLSMQYGVGR